MTTEHQVRERAYYIWEDEGRCFGRADAHWFQAQAELQAGRVEAPLTVQPVLAETSAAPSPAKSLTKTLAKKTAKPAASRAKAPAKVAVATRKSPRAASAETAALH